MTRETTFWIGGFLTIGLGLALAVGLGWAGAGVEYSSAYFAVALAMVLGSFFLYVAGAEARERESSPTRWDAERSEDRSGGRTHPP